VGQPRLDPEVQFSAVLPSPWSMEERVVSFGQQHEVDSISQTSAALLNQVVPVCQFHKVATGLAEKAHNTTCLHTAVGPQTDKPKVLCGPSTSRSGIHLLPRWLVLLAVQLPPEMGLLIYTLGGLCWATWTTYCLGLFFRYIVVT